MTESKRHSIFLGIATIFMFFNSAGLPDGLLYTTLLAPVFLLFLLNQKGIRTYLLFLLITGALGMVHAVTGIDDPFSYVRSFAMLQAVAIFTIITYDALPGQLEQAGTFKTLATVNLLMLGICLLLRFIPGGTDWVWYTVPISPGVPVVPRLKMFTYEASYYSLLITPLVLYYLLKCWLCKAKVGVLFLSLILSLLLSFSLGVIAGIVISLFLMIIFRFNTLYTKLPVRWLMIASILLIILTVGLYIFYPQNALFLRLHNIWAGKDTSARGRTYEAFTIAWEVAKMKSLYWGTGPGQLKSLGRDYIIQYYHYAHIPQTVRIPNAVAETLSIYGIAGLIIRFGLILFLFIRTRVWNNYYRLSLFIFMFIYQFTGSFISNTAEYMIWAIAFCPGILRAFEVPPKKETHDESTVYQQG